MSAQGSETLGKKCEKKLFASLKGLRGQQTPAQLLQSCSFEKWDAFSQGCQNATLGWNWRTLSALFFEWVIDSTFCAEPWSEETL
jgi:hypothetical protein